MLAPRRVLWSSPTEVVQEALDLVGPLSSDDRVVDLGCGDGRFLIGVAKASGARCLGVEIVPERAAEAQRKVREAGLESLIEIRCENASARGVAQFFLHV